MTNSEKLLEQALEKETPPNLLVRLVRQKEELDTPGFQSGDIVIAYYCHEDVTQADQKLRAYYDDDGDLTVPCFNHTEYTYLCNDVGQEDAFVVVQNNKRRA